jgi:hypothetical protein
LLNLLLKMLMLIYMVEIGEQELKMKRFNKIIHAKIPVLLL